MLFTKNYRMIGLADPTEDNLLESLLLLSTKSYVRNRGSGLKIRGATEKYLLREAAKPVITEKVYRREKHPFHTPLMTTAPKERFHKAQLGSLRDPFLRSKEGCRRA
jgi:hypothetical protein